MKPDTIKKVIVGVIVLYVVFTLSFNPAGALEARVKCISVSGAEFSCDLSCEVDKTSVKTGEIFTLSCSITNTGPENVRKSMTGACVRKRGGAEQCVPELSSIDIIPGEERIKVRRVALVVGESWQVSWKLAAKSRASGGEYELVMHDILEDYKTLGPIPVQVVEEPIITSYEKKKIEGLAWIHQDEEKIEHFEVTEDDKELTSVVDWEGSDIDTFLYNPRGIEVTLQDKGVTFSGHESKPEIWRVKNPEPGKWALKIKGRNIEGDSEVYYRFVGSSSKEVELIPAQPEKKGTYGLTVVIVIAFLLLGLYGLYRLYKRRGRSQ
jgi:hypothetical protein